MHGRVIRHRTLRSYIDRLAHSQHLPSFTVAKLGATFRAIRASSAPQSIQPWQPATGWFPHALPSNKASRVRSFDEATIQSLVLLEDIQALDRHRGTRNMGKVQTSNLSSTDIEYCKGFLWTHPVDLWTAIKKGRRDKVGEHFLAR